MNDLKKEYEEFNETWNGGKEYTSFLEAFPEGTLETMKLDEYTAIKGKGEKGKYFTYWLEQGTSNCGKFRTASSYTYGIYKVNHNNKPKGIEDEKWKGAQEGYRSVEIRNESKDKFVSVTDAAKYFEDKVRPILINLVAFKDIENLKPLEVNYCRKISYLYNPDKLIPIYKNEVIQSIADYFKVDISSLAGSYKITEPILKEICTKFEITITEGNRFEVTQKLGVFLWKKFGQSFPIDSKNMILHGAPGTGKTYAVENTIKQRLALEEASAYKKYYKLVQFHPSFGYEEFIDGIKPNGIENGQMQFKLVNGIFKQMCIDAAEELKNPTGKKDGKGNCCPKEFYFIADEVNRAELSQVFGEILLCLEKDKRLRYKDGRWEGTMVDTLNSALWEDENAVCIQDGARYFGVPENVYFIGTMNDIDRSVDSFDMALRRRFVWKHYQCDYQVIAEHEMYQTEANLEKYIDACKSLNDHVTGSKGFNLGEQYQLGHSYFIKPKNLNKTQLQKVWDENLEPLLQEYLRAEVPSSEIKGMLKKAKEKFSLSV